MCSYPQPSPAWANRNRKAKPDLFLFLLFLSFPLLFLFFPPLSFPVLFIPFRPSLLSFFLYPVSMNSPRENWTLPGMLDTRNPECPCFRLLGRSHIAFWKRLSFLAIYPWLNVIQTPFFRDLFSGGLGSRTLFFPYSVCSLTGLSSSANLSMLGTRKTRGETSSLFWGGLWAHIYRNFTLHCLEVFEGNCPQPGYWPAFSLGHMFLMAGICQVAF